MLWNIFSYVLYYDGSLERTQYSQVHNLECLMLDAGRIHKNLKYFETMGCRE